MQSSTSASEQLLSWCRVVLRGVMQSCPFVVFHPMQPACALAWYAMMHLVPLTFSMQLSLRGDVRQALHVQLTM
jgi:hypothetical protein